MHYGVYCSLGTIYTIASEQYILEKDVYLVSTCLFDIHDMLLPYQALSVSHAPPSCAWHFPVLASLTCTALSILERTHTQMSLAEQIVAPALSPWLIKFIKTELVFYSIHTSFLGFIVWNSKVYNKNIIFDKHTTTSSSPSWARSYGHWACIMGDLPPRKWKFNWIRKWVLQFPNSLNALNANPCDFEWGHQWYVVDIDNHG